MVRLRVIYALMKILHCLNLEHQRKLAALRMVYIAGGITNGVYNYKLYFLPGQAAGVSVKRLKGLKFNPFNRW